MYKIIQYTLSTQTGLYDGIIVHLSGRKVNHFLTRDQNNQHAEQLHYQVEKIQNLLRDNLKKHSTPAKARFPVGDSMLAFGRLPKTSLAHTSHESWNGMFLFPLLFLCLIFPFMLGYLSVLQMYLELELVYGLPMNLSNKKASLL